ncbi:MAG: hypothetical protein KDC44_20480, partial [Phaeodactylibacter sp.]|nr:hypothetical protein [Phaeodactylibacter sp.]
MMPKHYARKRRQLRFLSKQLERKLQQTTPAQISGLEQLIGRIRRLATELAGVFSKQQLRRLAGAAAVFIGLAAPQVSQAQSFADPVINPFNITPFGYFSFPAFTDLDNDGD